MVLFEGRNHICDGGFNCSASKGILSRVAKAIMSDFVRECTDNLASSLCCDRCEECILDPASLKEFFPAGELTGLFFPCCASDAFVDIDPCKTDSIQQVISSSSW